MEPTLKLALDLSFTHTEGAWRNPGSWANYPYYTQPDIWEDVARAANVPVDRVLRYAGPVLQERAMLAQHARRTRLRSSDRGASLAEVVDARLGKHGVDM